MGLLNITFVHETPEGSWRCSYPGCGREFNSKSGLGLHYSHSHTKGRELRKAKLDHSAKLMTRKRLLLPPKMCPHCQKEFFSPGYEIHIKGCKNRNHQTSDQVVFDQDSNGRFVCPECRKTFSKYGIKSHFWRAHLPEGQKFKSTPAGTQPWNTGLTNETDDRVRKNSESVQKTITDPSYQHPSKGIPLSLEKRKAISDGIKRAVKAGKRPGWLGRRHSEAERIFEQLILSGFEDREYKRNYTETVLNGDQFFFLDFAWPHKKRYIEIDGEQHFTEEAQSYDAWRDSLLAKDKGWTVLRIRWSHFCSDKKTWFLIAKDFIDNLASIV